MKKSYMKPAMEIDRYTLDMSIASNCGTVVDAGPAAPELGINSACEGWKKEDPFKFSPSEMSTMAVYNVSFYEENCDCYYTAGGEGYWMS